MPVNNGYNFSITNVHSYRFLVTKTINGTYCKIIDTLIIVELGKTDCVKYGPLL